MNQFVDVVDAQWWEPEANTDPTPHLQLVPDTMRERAHIAEHALLDGIISRPARPFVPLRSI